MKKLTKSNNKTLCGVCGGIAEYFDFDPTWVRAGYALVTICTGFPGVIVYAVLSVVMPKKDVTPLPENI